MPLVAIKELKRHLPPKSRLMGVDHGEKTYGLSLSNPDLTIATPLKTLRRGKFSENIRDFAKISAEYGVKGFIIGLPLNMDNTEGPRCDAVRHFADNLLKAKELLGFDPVISFWDERLSTAAMEDRLIEDLDMSRKKRQEVINHMAAAFILQGALDSLRD